MGNFSSNPNVNQALVAAAAIAVVGILAHQASVTHKKNSGNGCCGSCECSGVCDQGSCECGCPCSQKQKAGKGGCCGGAGADDQKDQE